MIFMIVASWALVGDVPPPQQAGVNPPEKKDRMVCRTVEMTGTRMGGGRVCKTESEWQKDKEDAERMLNGRRDLENPPASPFAPPKP